MSDVIARLSVLLRPVGARCFRLRANLPESRTLREHDPTSTAKYPMLRRPSPDPAFYAILTLYVCMYGHTYGKGMDQPGKVASPARGQLNRKNEYFPIRVRAWEFGLARRPILVPVQTQYFNTSLGRLYREYREIGVY